MKIIMWKGTKIGEMHDDGRLAYGNPCLVEMFELWDSLGGILRFSGSTIDGVSGDIPHVVPQTLDEVTGELNMVGFNVVDVPDTVTST